MKRFNLAFLTCLCHLSFLDFFDSSISLQVAVSYSNGDDLNDTFNITRKPTETPEKSSSGFSLISQDTLKSVTSSTMSEAVLHDATL